MLDCFFDSAVDDDIGSFQTPAQKCVSGRIKIGIANAEDNGVCLQIGILLPQMFREHGWLDSTGCGDTQNPARSRGSVDEVVISNRKFAYSSPSELPRD